MAPARDPKALQKLTPAHLLAAAQAWDSTGRISNFKSKTPREVIIGGRRYPTKAIIALAHELAGLGTLTSQELAGKAARRRLEALGFDLADGLAVEPWSAEGLRLAATAWATDAAACQSGARQGAEDPVQVVIDDVEYPAGAVLGLPAGPGASRRGGAGHPRGRIRLAHRA
ncbi:hypothetical protein [Cupriavidus necator]|uniref:hypothetical protein n=1 Tax=Cupriavidus necator TaxID=106590 RepID=UPI00339D514C